MLLCWQTRRTGKVLHLGFNPAATKYNGRRRRANLKSKGFRRSLRHLSRKQSRRTTHENHIVSQQIVSYAVKHHRMVVVENLESVGKAKSKIRGYVEKLQWAFYQLLSFIQYKAALHGIMVATVNPAYPSQDCSRCGQRNTANGKKYVCEHCGDTDHSSRVLCVVIVYGSSGEGYGFFWPLLGICYA